ncbi:MULTISPECIES: hypothetical protein [unclassified Roseofilum]|nr:MULTISPECIES: hypothetical protein [unclassified Roseofilum]
MSDSIKIIQLLPGPPYGWLMGRTVTVVVVRIVEPVFGAKK